MSHRRFGYFDERFTDREKEAEKRKVWYNERKCDALGDSEDVSAGVAVRKRSLNHGLGELREPWYNERKAVRSLLYGGEGPAIRIRGKD